MASVPIRVQDGARSYFEFSGELSVPLGVTYQLGWRHFFIYLVQVSCWSEILVRLISWKSNRVVFKLITFETKLIIAELQLFLYVRIILLWMFFNEFCVMLDWILMGFRWLGIYWNKTVLQRQVGMFLSYWIYIDGNRRSRFYFILALINFSVLFVAFSWWRTLVDEFVQIASTWRMRCNRMEGSRRSEQTLPIFWIVTRTLIQYV